MSVRSEDLSVVIEENDARLLNLTVLAVDRKNISNYLVL